MDAYEVNINMRKARNGWTVSVTPLDRFGDEIEDGNGRSISEEFILPGDLDAEALGKEIVATLVSLRIGEQTKKRR